MSCLDQLAVKMGASVWQRSDVDRIKDTLGYRFLSWILGALELICCGNLYSYIGAENLWLKNETSANHHDRQSSWDPSSGQVAGGQATLLDEMNERTFGRKRKFTSAILMSRLVLVACLASGLGISTSVYFQYRRDYYRFNLVRLGTIELFVGQNQTAPQAAEKQLYPAGLTNERVLALRRDLRAKEREAQAALKMVGSFLGHHTFFGENVYLFFVAVWVCTYLAPMIYYRMAPLDLHHLRFMLDWDQEQLNCNRMIEYTVKQFVTSCENFSLIVREQLHNVKFGFKSEPTGWLKLDDQDQFERGAITAPGNSFYRARIATTRSKKLAPGLRGTRVRASYANERKNNPDLAIHNQSPIRSNEHTWVIAKLTHFALNGQLQPLDRSKVDELATRLFGYAALATLVLGAVVGWDAFAWAYFMPIKFGLSYELDPMDQLTMFEMIMINMCLNIGLVLYLGILLAFCLEQVNLMNKIRSKIALFIVDKRKLLTEPQCESLAPSIDLVQGGEHEKSGADFTELYESINSDLLLILMHYRIIVTQFKPAQKPLGFLLVCCLSIMIITAVSYRLHIPYVSNPQFKFSGLIIFFIMVAGTDAAYVPVCWLHSRCLDLYKSLWSLMAALVSMAEHPKYGFLLSEHSIWLLRKELSHPEEFQSRFAIRAFGLEFTYAELVRFHFWLGLVVLSFAYDIEANDSSLPSEALQNNMLSDPLRFFARFRALLDEWAAERLPQSITLETPDPSWQ